MSWSGPSTDKIPIKDLVDLKAQCRVWSMNEATGATELQPIENWFENPGSPILEITLRDGSSIRCTPDHKVWTDRGWVRADHIGYDDVLPCPPLLDVTNGLCANIKSSGENAQTFVRCQDRHDSSVVEWAMAIGAMTCSPIARSSDSFSGRTPSEPMTNRVNGPQRDPKEPGKSLNGFRASRYLSSFIGIKSRRWSNSKPSLRNSVSNVLESGPIAEIRQSVIRFVAIKMPYFETSGAFSDKGLHHESVGAKRFLEPVLAKVVDKVPLINSRAEGASSYGEGLPVSTDGTRFTADISEVRDAIESFETGDRKPSLIHFVDVVHCTYCITVKGNHNFFAGSGINPVTIANCYDDPSDVGQMNSEAYIESVIYNHEQVMSSRLNDPKTGRRLIVQQRSHERDLTGHVLEKELGWDHLILPMEYEGPTKVTSIGWKDPRTKIGELMWPAKIGPAELNEIKATLRNGYAGQYQQRPAPGEGAKFKRHWWNFYNPVGTTTSGPIRLRVPGGEVIEKQPVTIPEAFEQVVQGWDAAFKDQETNDFVSGQAWGRVGANSYLLARDTRHMDFPETLRAIRKMSLQYPCPEKMIEDKANGPAGHPNPAQRDPWNHRIRDQRRTSRLGELHDRLRGSW